MNVLVTGGAGFIGSHFVRYMLSKYDYQIINFDSLTYAGNLNNLTDVIDVPNYHFVIGDITDKTALRNCFSKFEITTVINFAAESHVDRSIEDPESFLRTNCLGTQILLDVAREFWTLSRIGNSKDRYQDGTRFIQISTDEVYGSIEDGGLFTEVHPLTPNSPYAASKASADLLVKAYFHTYGLPVNITRCSNNYGPYQFPEKLIPLMINNAINDQPLPVYGDGLQVRDWIFVEDHCSAIDTVLHRGIVGQVYNIGARSEKFNVDVVKEILSFLGKSENLIAYVKDRPGHDRRYALDNAKIVTELGWVPSYSFEVGLAKTIQWYIENERWMQDVTSGEYRLYYEKMYGDR